MPSFQSLSRSWPARVCRFAGTFVLVAALAACGVALPFPPSTSRTAIVNGDRDPHDGVSRAHRMPVRGIDISRYQGDIDWARVAREGVSFAFIKATEGSDYIDPKFLANWRGAASAGIPRAAYHFMYWCRPVHQQALWFMLNVPQDPTALPPVLDVEWNSHSATCPNRISAETARAMVQEMLDTMEIHTGKRPIIYTDIPFHRDVLAGGEFDDYPFWVRSVAAEPREVYPRRAWTFWQYTTTGTIPGIAGDVDRNAFVGNAGQWQAWLQGMGIGQPGA